MEGIYLLLGGNIGDRLFYLQSAKKKVEIEVGRILQKSSIYETAPWGVPDQPDFLNQVIEIETELSPIELLEKILAIEIDLGRERHHKWYARTIDIDILLYADQVIHSQGFDVPHLRLPLRRFGLIPLAEIAPTFVHPKLNKTISQLLADCEDKLEVKKYEIQVI
jgi:2-amino-4-hydroxy-6-hydroxymethyldihydropteridine diphosphokinase